LTHPVEGRAQIVDELFAGVYGSHFVCELPGFGDVWVAGLDPEEISVGTELLGSLGCCGEAGAVVIEAFPGTRAVA
jgi:hypothetical protein